jgi:predicted 3-demethylubiquinone-9 3-methyltransferase (glyoxalase superfamily)
VDRLWERLSEGGKRCNAVWLQDKYGVSWQVVPTVLIALINDTGPVKSNRVMQAMLQMNKIDIEGLRQAYER